MIVDDGDHIIRIRSRRVYIDVVPEEDYCEESETLEHIFRDGECVHCEKRFGSQENSVE